MLTLLLRWFLFEKVIQALVTQFNTYSLKLKQLNLIIQRFCFIDDELEVDAMLNFYHDLGVIVRHRSTVVLQAQWLIDLFRQLITIRSYESMVRNLDVRWLHQLHLYWSEEVCSEIVLLWPVPHRHILVPHVRF